MFTVRSGMPAAAEEAPMVVGERILSFQPRWCERTHSLTEYLAQGLPERPEYARRILDAVAAFVAADHDLIVQRAVPWFLEQMPPDRVEAMRIIAELRAAVDERSTAQPSEAARA